MLSDVPGIGTRILSRQSALRHDSRRRGENGDDPAARGQDATDGVVLILHGVPRGVEVGDKGGDEAAAAGFDWMAVRTPVRLVQREALSASGGGASS